MTNYDNSSFDCTISVSRHGHAVLMSNVPDLDGWAIDGDILSDEGWKDLPSERGFYRCRIRVSFSYDDPVFICEECFPTSVLIAKSEVVLDSTKQ